ncbi:LTA synthase family protein [Lactobacillus xujianguonis]|uniref:LTA synthase family protein n=1 Tax=Lactobacillus xujianguonis TaxID=2495899 RepID=A0A437SU12_9LACO|nr:LTA synthase family protein [Lactobacillus xujianguonis]RVU70380.1 LTA synthase family protein [Lactobacillus xujianguonis]RVU73487.1 LTA synthase family protein [Lactobacillus xujianguonis]
MKESKKKSLTVWQIICLLAATFFMLVQIYQFGGTLSRFPLGSLLRFVSIMASNATMIFIPMVFGAVYSKRKVHPMEGLRFWILAVVTLILFYLVYFFRLPGRFNMWRLWGVFFPILTSTSVTLAGIIFSFLVQPYLYDLQHKITTKQNLLILSLLTVVGFATSAGTMDFKYSIYGVYLILYFAWGMFLANTKISSKAFKWTLLGGFVSFLVVFIGVPGFNGVYWYQLLSGRSGGLDSWNRFFLNNPSSPFMALMVIAIFLIFRKVIAAYTSREMRYFIPVIVLMEAPVSGSFMKSFRFTASAGFNKFLMVIIMMIVVLLLGKLYNKYLFRIKPLRRAMLFASKRDNLAQLVEDTWAKFLSWAYEHRIQLMTWGWFYIVSFISFLIESDELRIQITTATDINAVIFLLGTRFFAIILTTIFLDAMFTIFYFVTTRYWTSNVLVTVITIGWAVANKVKLNLRGEPIYPSELSEATNMKTLIPMIGQSLLIVVGIALIIVIALDVFLEIKFPIKKKSSWRHRGIWALLSLLLFLTPIRFNHDGGVIYHINRGFDNKQSFRNPERDIQINGPILNFLNYIDLQIMNKPSNYSKSTIDHLNAKYQKIADEINKSRKNTLKDQTVVFNLSESFVDPYTFPTIKIDSSAPNPVKFIQSMKKRATYGSMLSAGYGGGTANMEWETLTGLNMGMFRSTLTPYVQVVPRYKYYPTIGMDFDYKSAVHPFIGSYYSRVEDYKRFKFNKFVYVGSKYKIIDQKKLGSSSYNSDFTAYANGLKQINSQKGGQFINLISIQNHMPYNNWYPKNEYMGKISGDLFKGGAVKQQMATYVKGVQYTDKAVKQFIGQIDKIKKPITIVFYGDHYPSILSQSYTAQYPVQMHSTRYFIYSNKYAREHGAKTKLRKKTNYVNTSDFIALMLEQTNSKVTPYQALLTEVQKKLPAITINFEGDKGFELINQKGQKVDPKSLNNEQQALLNDYETIQYDMTAGDAYGLKAKGFYTNN